MGCGGSTPADNGGGGGGGRGGNADQDLKSKQLEEELERQNQEDARIIKLLVLGTGESGKSTVFKQMKILYSVPDPPSKFVMICRANLFSNAHAVVEGMKRLKIEFKDEAAKAASDIIAAVPPDGNPENIETLSAPLKTMYKDAGVMEAIERAAEYQLNDSTVYFWERCDEICKADYMPTEQDVLRARVRTTGIVQQNFQIKDKKYTMFDVGGQRNERRKWIHCFDNVTAVIFVTAISEYDQVRIAYAQSPAQTPFAPRRPLPPCSHVSGPPRGSHQSQQWRRKRSHKPTPGRERASDCSGSRRARRL